VTFRDMLAPATAVSLALAAVGSMTLAAAPAAAQEVVQDEGAAYRAWFEASQAPDKTKALEAAKAYLAKYPAGQYAVVLKNWIATTQMTALDTAIKERRTADVIKIGREILAGDPENLNVLYAVAFDIRRNELLASPPSYEHAADAVDIAKKAIALIEAGKTLTGVQSFDKNATLAWLVQILAFVEHKNGSAEETAKLFERSTALAPLDPQIAARNLLALVAIYQSGYAEAAREWNALPDAERAAAEPKPEVKATHDKLDAAAEPVIEAAARFVAFAKVKNLSATTRDRVNQLLEATYKTRHPEDAELAGLQKLLQEKEAALAAPAGAGN
jgi:hypothetical protein